jgi:hypothetical protein
MISDLDTYRAANMLIEGHGPDALIEAPAGCPSGRDVVPGTGYFSYATQAGYVSTEEQKDIIR